MEAFFESTFKQLTNYEPFRWQTRLFERMIEGHIPQVCDLSTGLGKTAVIHVWLIALGWQLRNGAQITVPRRLVYVVNRRTVVDQATEEAVSYGAGSTRPAIPSFWS